MEEELYAARNIKSEIVDKMKALEDQVEDLMNENERLKALLQTAKNQVYVERKHDDTDRKLSKFICTYPEREKLKILFIRESEGVYIFGSKRVYIKCEKGGQIFCRVGGGFMHIEEFIEQYTPGEVAKVAQRDVMQNFQNKMAVQQIAIKESDERREVSPIRKKQRPGSPIKGSPKKTVSRNFTSPINS